MNALSKAMIAESLLAKGTLNKADARILIDAFFETVRETLAQGETVKLSGFGNFLLRDKSERPGRNPKTGVETAILSRRVVTFRPGFKLKRNVEERSS